MLTIFLALIFTTFSSAQQDIQIGTSDKYTRSGNSGFFDFSDPTGINIKVQIWGYVKYAGYYIIPARSSVNDLISLAGGPLEDALVADIRILRANPDSSNTMYKYNYNDLLWEEELSAPVKFPRLNAGDMVVVPGEPRYFVRQDIAFYLGIVTSLASITALILSILSFSN